MVFLQSAFRRSFGKLSRIIFLGAPGAGKGTYASRLMKTFAIPHISTGDIIREEIKKGSTLGKEVQRFSKSGQLVPDEVVIEIAKKRLKNQDCARGYILDGFPRTVTQAEQLQAFNPPTLCVNLYLPHNLLVEKLCGRRVCHDCGANYNVADICNGEYDMPPLLPKPEDCEKCMGEPNLEQRVDDKEDVVRQRLEVYRLQTEPLIDYYGSHNLLLHFHVKQGVKDFPTIYEQITQRLQI